MPVTLKALQCSNRKVNHQYCYVLLEWNYSGAGNLPLILNALCRIQLASL